MTLNKGVSTLDLVVAEFQSGCRQMDLASACVLRPLNRLVLDFMVWARGQVNEWRSGGVLDRRCRRGLRAREEVKVVILDEVANGSRLRGGNLVDIRTETESTVLFDMIFSVFIVAKRNKI